uniref:Predicted protein n=1 Tax=Hordeum vulgare subsp. vulgare TaxID=112509 RepID=F2D1R4_HORVV|nr:predicted protein [Hordeum vulgare subsp. vulgare]
MASSPVGVSSLGAHGLVALLQIMALLVFVVMMSSSYTCHGAGRSLLGVSVGEEKVPHYEIPAKCFVPPCH